MKRSEAITKIQNLTSKYKWDGNEDYKLDQILKEYGKSEFESSIPGKDAEIINSLETCVKEKSWKLIFNHDDADGFFAEVQMGYHNTDIVVADLKPSTKRETLRESMLAAVEFLQNPHIKPT